MIGLVDISTSAAITQILGHIITTILAFPIALPLCLHYDVTGPNVQRLVLAQC